MNEKPLTEKINDLKVLYVEDEASIRDAVTELLSRRVVNLFVAKNGIEGLEVFEKEHPEIVITDIRMPQMDGLQMSRRIKEINPGVKVIVTSAYSDSTYFIDAIEIGINEYVLKPVSRNKLFEALYKCADIIYIQRNAAKQFETISRLHQAIEHSQSMVIITDRNQKIEYLNPRFTEITGYMFNEVVADAPLVDFDTLCTMNTNPDFQQLIDNNSNWRGEYTIQHKNGDLVWLYGSLSPVTDMKGQVSSYVLVGEDISEIKQMAATLADKEDKLRNLIEKLGEGIGIIDLTFDFVFCNAAMNEIFEERKLVDRNLSSFVASPQEMNEIVSIARKLKIGEKQQLDVGIVTAEDSVRYVSITFTPQLDDTGAVTGIFCIFKDISRIRELIEELEAARDAAEKAYETIEEKNMQLNDTNAKLQESEKKLSELNAILMEYIKATGK